MRPHRSRRQAFGGTLAPQLRTDDSERLRIACSGSSRDLDIEIATFRLCGNVRIKTRTTY